MSAVNEGPLATVERLVQATNAHDLERLVACFAEDYVLEAPAHPERSFRGSEQVRRNWTQIFGGIPDVTARLVRSTAEGDAAWTEWEMSGTRRDGGAFLVRGVFIFGVTGETIRWGRMFLEPVDASTQGMDAALAQQIASPAGAKR